MHVRCILENFDIDIIKFFWGVFTYTARVKRLALDIPSYLFI